MPNANAFVQQTLASRLAPGETITAVGFLSERSLVRFAVGGALVMLGSAYHYAAVTPRRLFLIRVRMAMRGVVHASEGITEIELADIASVQVEDSAVQHTLVVARHGGGAQTHYYNRILLRAGGVGDDFRSALETAHRNAAHGSGSFAGVAPIAEPAAAAVAEGPDLVSQFRELAALRDAGALTDAEYGSLRADLLRRI